MLTNNEQKVLRLLMSALDKDYSINNVAKECSLAPNGAFKILKKFEKEGIVEAKKIANIKSYRLNFGNEKTTILLELALTPALEGRVKYRSEDFKELKEITKSCIMFGSYINLKKDANDLDILFILDKNNFREYKKRLAQIEDAIPTKIHDIVQTEEDLKNNILKKDKVIMNILKEGIILWGQRVIIGVIKDVYKG